MQRRDRDRIAAAWRRGALLLFALVLVGLSACQQQPGGEAGAAAESDKPTPIELAPPEPASPEQLPGALVEHIEAMTLIGKPLIERCDLLGPDLNAYFDLVEGEFDAAATIELSAEQRAAIKAGYEQLSEISGRCLSSEDGRRFSRRLLAKVRPLTGD